MRFCSHRVPSRLLRTLTSSSPLSLVFVFLIVYYRHFKKLILLIPMSPLNHSLAGELPDEILIDICRINAERDLDVCAECCRRDYPNRKNLKILPCLQDTISASQVSGHWRNVVIHTPTLWRHLINPSHPSIKWKQLVFERSRPLGITYSTVPSDEWIKENEFGNEMKYADQLTSYSAAVGSDCDVWKQASVPDLWPKLEYLCVAHKFTYEPWGVIDFDMRSSSNFPHRFPSAASTPMLKKLHFHHCSPANSLQIVGLIHLTELRVERSPHRWPKAIWLYVILNLPHLKRLSLLHSMSAGESSDKHTGPVHHLDVEDFCLVDCEEFVAYLFRHLEVRPTRVFELIPYPEFLWSTTAGPSAYIKTRIRPIINHLLTHNPLFLQNSALRIMYGFIECVGYDGEETPGGSVPWPPGAEEPGRSLFEGAHIKIDFRPGTLQRPMVDMGQAKMVELFRPVFDNINYLSFGDLGLVNPYDSLRIHGLNLVNPYDRLFLDGDFLTEILWSSSHRLRRLQGICPEAWAIIYRNMLASDLENGHPLHGLQKRSDMTFLSALVDLELRFLHTKLNPLDLEIVEFCEFKAKSGNPLRSVLGLWETDWHMAESDDRRRVIERLKEFGVTELDQLEHDGWILGDGWVLEGGCVDADGDGAT